MFLQQGISGIERFDLLLVDVASENERLRVPLVDGWLEIQLALSCVPGEVGKREFFRAVASLAAHLRRKIPAMRWYFLHKSPGLKLRFKIVQPAAGTLETVLNTVMGWPFAWVAATGIGSVFDQSELMPAPFRDDVERLLTLAADHHILAFEQQLDASEEGWSDFVVELLRALGLDTWLAFEAIERLRRLRGIVLGKADESPPSPELLDPRALLDGLPESFSPGFAASVSLLQAINLLLNIWGVDASAQRRILARSASITRPDILP